MKDTITAKGGQYLAPIGGIDYQILVDLKTLQGQKEPYFNATEIVKQYNDAQKDNLFGSLKRLNKWVNSKRFKEIINIWETQKGVPKSKLYFKKRDGKVYNVWIHKELFLSLMIWLDAKHEFEITQLVNKVVEYSDTALLTRADTKALSRPMTDQVKRLREKLFEEDSGAAPTYYSTLHRQIHKAVTAKPLKRGGIDHEALTIEQECLIGELRLEVEILIKERLDAEWTGREVAGWIKEYLIERQNQMLDLQAAS